MVKGDSLCALSVEKPSETIQALKYISEFTQGRDLTNVKNVEKPTSHTQALLTIKVHTLARRPIHVMNAEKHFSQAELL